MTVKDLWKVSPQSFVFIKDERTEKVKEYKGEKYGETLEIERVTPTSYPMYQKVLEVIVKSSREKSTVYDYRADILYCDNNGKAAYTNVFRANLETNDIKTHFSEYAKKNIHPYAVVDRIERSKPGKGKWEIIYDFWKRIDKTEV